MESALKACVPDDGKQWTLIKNEDDLDPFAGKFIACRSSNNWMRDAHKIDPESETGYVLVSVGTPLFAALGGHYYALYRMKSGESDGCYCLSDHNKQNHSWFVRLLTLQEARSISIIIGIPRSLDFYYPQSKFSFTLGNLLEEERRTYFWDRARKKVWPLQKLMHIGNKESGSAFSGMPRDIVRLIACQVIQQEANELEGSMKLEDALVLE
jgi:hypothetical protein